MPSLDSPLVPLAALYIAGNDSRGRRFTAGLNGKNLLAGSFGAASAEWAGNTVTNALGMGDTMTPELAQALVGAGLSRYGDPIPQNGPMAAGIMYNVGAQAMQNLGVTAGDLFGDVFNGGAQAITPEPTQQSPTPTPTPESQPVQIDDGPAVETTSGVTF